MKAFVTLPRGTVFDTFFTPENVALAHSLGEVVWNETDRHLTPDEIAARIGDCDTYVTGWGSPRLDQTILSAAPNLRLLTHLCGTVVPFVSDEMWDRGIRVLSGNRFFAESVAEGTLAYILAALRDIPAYSHRLHDERRWKKSTDYNRGLAGKRIGIVSYGAIARHLVRLLSVFRVKLFVYDIAPLPAEDVARYGLTQASLEEIFSTCDIVTVHTPLFDATHHLIGRDLLSLLRKDTLFVNTSRGAVIDQTALEQELATGRFRAVLDVYEQEPPPQDCPLYDLPNVLMMPHMGGPTVDLRAFITETLLRESYGFLHENAPIPSEITRQMSLTMSRR
ncbi:MAG: hydroxyacid dehydrogenase [Clostridia bacterium]|nr:hydroxyacid dehydrogenase [Clostridia bacterium]